MTRLLGFTKRLPALSVLALSAAGVWFFLAGILGSLSYRYPFEYGEPVVLLPVLRMHENPLIYGDPARLPHLLMPYNPLYLYFSYAVSWITGANYTSGRIVTAAAALASAALIALICRRRSDASRIVSVIAGLTFLTSPFLLAEATHMKPDFTALAFALGGLYLGSGPGRKNIVGSAVCFALAFLTKQNYLLAAAAVAIYWLSQKKYAKTVGFTALAAGFALLAVAWLAWATRGNYWAHTLLNANTFYSSKILLINLQKIAPGIGSLLVGGAVACAALLAAGKSRAVCIYYLCVAPTLLFLGKGGWGENHAIEPLAVSLLAIGSFVGGPARGLMPRLLRFCLCAVVGVQLITYLPHRQWDPRGVRAGLASNERAMDELLPILRSARGPVLAENMGLLIAAGLPVWYQTYEFAQMAYSGRFDQEIVLRELRGHHYAMVIVETNLFRARKTGRFTPEFIQTLGANYRPVAFKTGQYIFVPSPKKAGVPA